MAAASPPHPDRRRPLVAAYFGLCAVCFALLLSGAAVPGGGPRRFETAHYRVHTDLDEALSRDLADELEFCYGEFTRRLEMFRSRDADSGGEKFNVYLFAREADYNRFTGGRFPNTGGIFMSGPRALAVYLEGQGRAAMRKTLRHEAFHQFADDRLGDGLPVWVNEGLAQIFEESVRVGDGLRIGLLPPERLRQLRYDNERGRLFDFATLIRYSDDDWARTLIDRGRAATQYTQAWAMVHFLLYASGPDGRPLYRERFNRMLERVAAGADGWTAFTAEFGTNFAGFRGRFDAYVAALQPSEEARMLEDQRILAELLVLLKQRNVGFSDAGDFERHVVERKYRLECRRDDVTWSTDADAGVYFRDARDRPLTPRGLRFVPDPGGAMPALERRPGDGLTYRTRFYNLAGRVLHETLCTPGD